MQWGIIVQHGRAEDKSQSGNKGLIAHFCRRSALCPNKHVTLQETFDAAAKENQEEFGMEVNMFTKLIQQLQTAVFPTLCLHQTPRAAFVQPEEAMQSAMEEFKLQVTFMCT